MTTSNLLSARAFTNFATGRVVRVPKRAEHIADQIRGTIIRGEIGQGDSLPLEADLIAQFHASRPIIREALRILESEDLIVLPRGARGGAKVQPLTGAALTQATGHMLQALGATIGDVYKARTLIEPEAAKLAAEIRAGAAAEALQRCVDGAREVARNATKVADFELIRLETIRFHRTLLQQCGNVTLAVLAYALEDVVDRHKSFVYRAQSEDNFKKRMVQVLYGLKSEERLIQLIREGRGTEAKDHWHRHMVNAGTFWLNSIATKEIVEVVR